MEHDAVHHVVRRRLTKQAISGDDTCRDERALSRSQLCGFPYD
jgi:hypothetical protein